MEIKIGQIVNAYHTDDNKNQSQHPFLIINVTKHNIFAVQCSSVKIADEKSYFSRKGDNYYRFQFTGLEYETDVGLSTFYKINNEDIKTEMMMTDHKDFLQVCKKLKQTQWPNTRYLNDNQILNHIYKGVNNYGQTWTLLK